MDKGKAIMQCGTPPPPPESSHTGTDLVSLLIVKRLKYYELDDFQKEKNHVFRWEVKTMKQSKTLCDLISDMLNCFAERLSLTDYMSLQAVYRVLLYRHSGEFHIIRIP